MFTALAQLSELAIGQMTLVKMLNVEIRYAIFQNCFLRLDWYFLKSKKNG